MRRNRAVDPEGKGALWVFALWVWMLLSATGMYLLMFTRLQSLPYGGIAFHISLSLFWATVAGQISAVDWRRRRLHARPLRLTRAFLGTLLPLLVIGYFLAWGGYFVFWILYAGLAIFIFLGIFIGWRLMLLWNEWRSAPDLK